MKTVVLLNIFVETVIHQDSLTNKKFKITAFILKIFFFGNDYCQFWWI